MSNHPVQHPEPDRLLEFAYGEIPEREAEALLQHVEDCAACGEALAEIGGVRRAMAPLGEVPAPNTGLESLLAYADQSAARARRDVPPRGQRGWWWRLLPVALTGLLVAGGVMWNAREMFGASAHALAGQVSEPGARGSSERLAFHAAPGEIEREENAFAPEVAAVEAATPPAPEQKRRSPSRERGARAAPPAPPPPVAMAPRAVPEPGAPASVEGRPESTTLGGADDSARVGRAPPSASEVASRDAFSAPAIGTGAMKSEEEAVARAPGGSSGSSPSAERAAPAPEAPASAASRRARKKSSVVWSVPSEHTQRLQEREQLREEVKAGGISLALPEALGRLCRLEDALEEHTAADATCRRLLELDPGSLHAGFARSRAHQREGL